MFRKFFHKNKKKEPTLPSPEFIRACTFVSKVERGDNLNELKDALLSINMTDEQKILIGGVIMDRMFELHPNDDKYSKYFDGKYIVTGSFQPEMIGMAASFGDKRAMECANDIHIKYDSLLTKPEIAKRQLY